MTVCNTQLGVPGYSQNNCGTTCSSDFCIKRHDTRPAFKVSVSDCDGPMDLTSELLVVEASMWSNVKLKTSISETDEYFRLADDVGFQQIMQNDIIVVDRTRLPEQMLVTGFDEANKLIRVQRGYHGTLPASYKKGQTLKAFRILNSPGEIELVYDDILNVDGSTSTDQLIDSYLVYNFSALDTCVPGCFLLEFRLLKMAEPEPSVQLTFAPEIIPSFTPSTYTPTDFGCVAGEGIEWERRFPTSSEGFVIGIIDSPTSEILL
ncbi:MAG: hypothetical protein M0R80_01655 [Proteobacteria bacterium]|jgi:hypothetical protein|nr:hypothetical protein [Pseudomonadota bacterium]